MPDNKTNNNQIIGDFANGNYTVINIDGSIKVYQSSVVVFEINTVGEIVFDNTGTQLNALNLQAAVKELDRRQSYMNEPTGFVRTSPDTMGVLELSPDGTTIYTINGDGTYSTNTSGNFADGTIYETVAAERQIAIYPKPSEGDILFFIDAKEYHVTTIKILTLDNTTGTKVVYFDTDLELHFVMSPPDATYFLSKPLVASVYGNATHQELIVFGDERHGIQMEGSTHRWIHFAEHAKYISGMELIGVSAGSTTLTEITAGLFFDDDIDHNILAASIMQFWYLEGSEWRTIPDSNLLGYINPPDTYISYNEDLGGGLHQLAEITGVDFSCMFLYATNNVVSPFVKILGQELYATVNLARVGIFDEANNLNLEGLPSPEFVPLYGYILNRDGQIQTLADGSAFVTLKRKPGTIYDLV